MIGAECLKIEDSEADIHGQLECSDIAAKTMSMTLSADIFMGLIRSFQLKSLISQSTKDPDSEPEIILYSGIKQSADIPLCWHFHANETGLHYCPTTAKYVCSMPGAK